MRKLEQYASWLEREWPSAAASLREGLREMFTVNRLGLPPPLRRCLTTTNIIDSSHAGFVSTRDESGVGGTGRWRYVGPQRRSGRRRRNVESRGGA